MKLESRKRRQAVYLPVNRSGRTQFTDVVFPAKARIPLRLLVRIPEEERQGEFEISVRQLEGREELGRVTWRLVSPRRRKELCSA